MLLYVGSHTEASAGFICSTVPSAFIEESSGCTRPITSKTDKLVAAASNIDQHCTAAGFRPGTCMYIDGSPMGVQLTIAPCEAVAAHASQQNVMPPVCRPDRDASRCHVGNQGRWPCRRCWETPGAGVTHVVNSQNLERCAPRMATSIGMQSSKWALVERWWPTTQT